MFFDFQPAGFETAIIIVGVLLFYYAYFFFAYSLSVERIIRNKSAAGSTEIILFFFRKLYGLFMLGIIPGILYFGLMKATGEKFGMTFNHLISSFMLIAGLVLIIAVILFFHHDRNPQKSTLQLNLPGGNIPLLMMNFLGWSLYLVAYEFLFRGILLFECYDALGFWPAVAVNVAIYSAIHMVHGKDQTIGALVFGTVACYFALTRGTLLIPIFMHLSLSIISDLYSIRNLQHVNPVSKNYFNSFEK